MYPKVRPLPCLLQPTRTTITTYLRLPCNTTLVLILIPIKPPLPPHTPSDLHPRPMPFQIKTHFISNK